MFLSSLAPGVRELETSELLDRDTQKATFHCKPPSQEVHTMKTICFEATRKPQSFKDSQKQTYTNKFDNLRRDVMTCTRNWEKFTKESMRVVSCWNRKVSPAVFICLGRALMVHKWPHHEANACGYDSSCRGRNFARAFTPFAGWRLMHGD